MNSAKLVNKVTIYYEAAVRWFERILALIIFVGLTMFLSAYVKDFFAADWAAINSFENMVHVVLSMIIGLEAVRLLSTHSLESVLELLAFVVARKALEPSATAVDLILIVIALTILIGGRYMLSCVIPKNMASNYKS